MPHSGPQEVHNIPNSLDQRDGNYPEGMGSLQLNGGVIPL